MDIDLYIKFFIACTFICATPGPTTLLVVYYAFSRGPQAGKYTIPAVLLGDIVAILIAFTSLEAISTIFPESFEIITTLGGIYMIYIGIESFVTKVHYIEEEKEYCTKKLGGMFTHVFLITSFNPKSLIFFLAFFPQFINKEENLFNQMIFLGSTFVVLGAFYALIYDLLAGKLQKLLKNDSVDKKIHQFTGTVMIMVGLITMSY